jgi:hypothetical protein
MVRKVLIAVLALVGLGLGVSPATAGASGGQTFTVTVSSKTWADAEGALSNPEVKQIYHSPQGLIYGYVCEDGGKWTAPIPKKIGSGPSGVTLRVTLSSSQVTKADAALRHETCRSDFGIRTVEQDYRWASQPSQIQRAVQTIDQALTPATTTTTAPPESPAQYEAACTNSPTYGALTSPNAQTGVCVTFEAQVFQYDTNTGTTEMLVDVTNDGYGDWSDLVELILPQSVASQNLIEDDVIQFWGTTTTPDTYTTENNGTNTIPAVNVKYATLVSAASS